MKPIASEVKHHWVWQTRGVYECYACGCWTSNLPLYKDEVCDAKDRRDKYGKDRRENQSA